MRAEQGREGGRTAKGGGGRWRAVAGGGTYPGCGTRVPIACLAHMPPIVLAVVSQSVMDGAPPSVVAGLDILNGVLGVELPRLLHGMEERLALQHMRTTPFEAREPSSDLVGFENVQMLHVGMMGVCEDVLVDIRRTDGEDMISDLCQDPDDLDMWRRKLEKLLAACPPDSPDRVSMHWQLKALAAGVEAGKVEDDAIRLAAQVQQAMLFDTGGSFTEAAANAVEISARGPGFLFIRHPDDVDMLPRRIRLRLTGEGGLFFDEWLRACAERLDLGAQPVEVSMWDMTKLCGQSHLSGEFAEKLDRCCRGEECEDGTREPLSDPEMMPYYREMRAWLRTLPTSMSSLISPGCTVFTYDFTHELLEF